MSFTGGASICEAYDAEAQSLTTRQWVKDVYSEGLACTVDEEILLANLPSLPSATPIFVLADGQRSLPQLITESISANTVRGPSALCPPHPALSSAEGTSLFGQMHAHSTPVKRSSHRICTVHVCSHSTVSAIWSH